MELVPFGPYRLPLNELPVPHRQLPEHDRGLPEPDATRRRTRTPCNQDFFTAARNAWLADIDARATAERATFDNMFWTSAGQDESGAWQEFGEMRFIDQDAVTDAFGPKHINPLHPRGNWASTRYIPWTSWAAAANVWPSASRQQLDRGRERRHGRLRPRALATT